MKRTFKLLAASFLMLGIAAMPSSKGYAQQKSSSSTKSKSSSALATTDKASADTLFMKRALAVGVAEIEFAQVALQNAKSEKVKDFAQKVIEHHTVANNKIQAILEGTATESDVATSGNAATGVGAGTGTNTETGAGSNTPVDTISNNAATTVDSVNISNAGNSTTATQAAEPVKPAKPTTELKLSGTYLDIKNKMEGLSGTEFDRQYMQQSLKDHNMTVKLLEKYQQEGDHPQLKAWVKEQLPLVRQHKTSATKLATSLGVKTSTK